MDLEQQLVEAITAELQRQAAEGGLKCAPADDGAVTLNGRVDLESLAAVVAGSVAGGP